MSIIQVLPENLVNKIAAGEVVERPYSVVKELVENSIDAYASKITIEIEDGGKERISITDDGLGMGPEDAKISLTNHATSKLIDADDLFSIETLGFRGEAIPSIASISKFVMKTRREEDSLGTEIIAHGNENHQISEVNLPKGTTIVVDDLFYNIPARKKFLKSTNTEFSHILEYITRMALCYPAIHFHLKHNQKLIHNFPSVKDIGQRLQQVFGFKKAEQMTPISFHDEDLDISGYIGSPELTRANMKWQYLYVNGRSVKDISLAHSVNSAYQTYVPKGQYPFFILFIQVKPDLVDVNVHPAKREVRFSQKEAIYSCIFDLVRTKLREVAARSIEIDNSIQLKTEPSGISYGVSSGKPINHRPAKEDSNSGFSFQLPSSPTRREFNPVSTSANNRAAQPMPSPYKTPDESAPSEGLFQEESKVHFKIIGQFAECYLLLEQEGRLLVIDQHALHERLRYEKLMEQYRAGQIERQSLMFPEVMDFTADEKLVLEAWIEKINNLGFEVEPFGGNSFAIKAIPQVLTNGRARELIEEILGQISELEVISEIEEQISHIIATVSCHSSVRGGEGLTHAQIEALLGEAQHSNYYATCPHGRNVVKVFSLNDVKKMFDRI